MFKILILEDNTEKLKNILTTLEAIESLNIDLIDHEVDASSAKKKLIEKAYDLLILDIAIPPKKSQPVDPEGGIKFLDEVLQRSMYNKPIHIIGLTGYDEVFIKAQLKFKEQVLSVIKYSVSDIEWQKELQTGVNLRISSKQSAEQIEPDYDYDIAFICALKTELDSIKNNGWTWTNLSYANDDTNYYESTLTLGDNNIRVVAAQAERMGMPAAAALSMKLILKFHPRYIVMTGIMAGVTGRVGLGDIVVTSPIWDWGSGKWIPEEEEKEKRKQGRQSTFLIDPFQFSIDRKISKQVTLLSNDSKFLFELRVGFGKNHPNHDIKVHEGAAASGASVLSDKATFEKIKEQHRKLLGIEMEAYGLFSAAEIAPRPKPLPICIKSVVDFGDSEKSDDYHEFASYASAQFAKILMERLLSDK